jgi:hypothetical protein
VRAGGDEAPGFDDWLTKTVEQRKSDHIFGETVSGFQLGYGA